MVVKKQTEKVTELSKASSTRVWKLDQLSLGSQSDTTRYSGLVTPFFLAAVSQMRSINIYFIGLDSWLGYHLGYHE